MERQSELDRVCTAPVLYRVAVIATATEGGSLGSEACPAQLGVVCGDLCQRDAGAGERVEENEPRWPEKVAMLSCGSTDHADVDAPPRTVSLTA